MTFSRSPVGVHSESQPLTVTSTLSSLCPGTGLPGLPTGTRPGEKTWQWPPLAYCALMGLRRLSPSRDASPQTSHLLPSFWAGSTLPDFASPWLGQVTLLRPGSYILIGCRGLSHSRMAPLASLCPWVLPLLQTLPFPPEVGRRTGTYITPGLEHWLLVS